MNKSEFRNLIREEIRRVMREADATPVGGYKPIGLQVTITVAAKTSDGKNYMGPYKQMPDTKLKLSILQKDGGYKIPAVEFMTMFRNQLIGKDLGKIMISVNVPWGSVDQMGKNLMALIGKKLSSDSVTIDRGATLANAGDLRNLLTNVISQKWPMLSDDAINNPKALKMMYGMGAAIERVAATAQGV